ncbi:MAG TPA: hypothetical protein VEH81_01715 [Ktedonobacteraceae bacterium]|nr:hypothetical protein [Ktedonobacteraceae bacterium]
MSSNQPYSQDPRMQEYQQPPNQVPPEGRRYVTSNETVDRLTVVMLMLKASKKAM